MTWTKKQLPQNNDEAFRLWMRHCFQAEKNLEMKEWLGLFRVQLRFPIIEIDNPQRRQSFMVYKLRLLQRYCHDWCELRISEMEDEKIFEKFKHKWRKDLF